MDETDIMARLKAVLPVDGPSGGANEDQLRSWLDDAAAEISRRRTPQMEATIELVEGTQEYDLPDGCLTVIQVIPGTCPVSFVDRLDMGIPSQWPMGAVLPTGQAITPSIALIQTQNRRVIDREFGWHVQSGKVVFDTPINTGVARLVYSGEDRDIENVPDRHVNLMLVYARFQALRTALHRQSFIQVIDPDGIRAKQIKELLLIADALEAEWDVGLGKIATEA